jgi:hypothetical protein
MTLAKTEFGGHFTATTVGTTECVLDTEVDVIEGTTLRTVGGVEAANYTGGARSEVQLASLPFKAKNVARKQRACEMNRHGTFYWHSHPLRIATLSPPSMGDFASHAVLGNIRNFVENGMVASTFVVAYEGIYEYGITPERFARECKIADELSVDKPRRGYELHGDVAAALRTRVFEDVRSANEVFYSELHTLRDGGGFSTTGAPTVSKGKWACAAAAECAVPGEFEFRRSLEDPDFVARLCNFHRINSYATRLEEVGFYYRYVPWSDGDVRLTLTVKE